MGLKARWCVVLIYTLAVICPHVSVQEVSRQPSAEALQVGVGVHPHSCWWLWLLTREASPARPCTGEGGSRGRWCQARVCPWRH